jgi:hypothetical protein
VFSIACALVYWASTALSGARPRVDEIWPWSLTSPWSTVAPFTIIGIYLAVNALFLQPYLGDVARYVRNSPANVAVRRQIRRDAVDTLKALHESGDYDRIVVVAHSLGTIVAYDMLRAYYSRICDEMPCDHEALSPEFEQLDRGQLNADERRAKGRELIRKLHRLAEGLRPLVAANAASSPKAWLVTDYVTLGSPLTNARYLLCTGEEANALQCDFTRRVNEREFPTDPPKLLPPDGRLTFFHPGTQSLRFHHGSMFAFTRWTNIYFPQAQLFWGDPIGGPVSGDDLFGSDVIDIPVFQDASQSPSWFTHTRYWDVLWGGADAPYLAALRRAVDLIDAEAANPPQQP